VGFTRELLGERTMAHADIPIVTLEFDFPHKSTEYRKTFNRVKDVCKLLGFFIERRFSHRIDFKHPLPVTRMSDNSLQSFLRA